MSSDEREHLREVLVGRARSVAMASGGILSGRLGKKVSAAEQDMLTQLERAFAVEES
jgi:hypothetical protein